MGQFEETGGNWGRLGLGGRECIGVSWREEGESGAREDWEILRKAWGSPGRDWEGVGRIVGVVGLGEEGPGMDE